MHLKLSAQEIIYSAIGKVLEILEEKSITLTPTQKETLRRELYDEGHATYRVTGDEKETRKEISKCARRLYPKQFNGVPPQ